MPEKESLNWYGSGDINNDQIITSHDLSRLDSLLSGSFSDQRDKLLHDRSDLDGDQQLSNNDRTLLVDYLDGNRGYLPAHWDKLSTKEERISWLEKVLVIDKTEDGIADPTYTGDFYSDQFLINTHGFELEALKLFNDNTLPLGNNYVLNSITDVGNRRAQAVSVAEDGAIISISIYHQGNEDGSGVILGIYNDDSGLPGSLLSATPQVSINANEGWQTIDLSSPIQVKGGETIWLAWVFQNNPGLRYDIGTPGRANSPEEWTGTMPAKFGESDQSDYVYSVYCNFKADKSIGIDTQHNGRFNLPFSYAGVAYNRPDLTMNRNLLAIIIGDNVFDWNDWCFVDPQWDQLIFPSGQDEPSGDESFPPLNNYLDDINNITKRDSISPLVDLSESGNSITLTNGLFELDYSLSDPNLWKASYCIESPKETGVIFRDSLIMNASSNGLIPGYNASGTIDLLLRNGNYKFSFEAADHFQNKTTIEFQVEVNDPPPNITIFSPTEGSMHTQELPSFHYEIEEPDFSSGWYSLDSGQTRTNIQQADNFLLDLEDGEHQIIVFAKDIFGNGSRDTVSFAVNKQTPVANFGDQENTDLMVYPNPVVDNLNILLHYPNSGAVQLDLLDVNRRILWTKSQKELSSSTVKYEVDMSGYAPGIYLLRCIHGDSFEVEKIIKY